MYGALITFAFPATAENAEEVAIVVADSVRMIWRKICGPVGMSVIESQAKHYVIDAPAYYGVRFITLEMEPPSSIAVSPWATQQIEWWPMVTTDGATLELRVKVTRHFSTNTVYTPLMVSRFQRLDICQFDPDETMPPDPEFTREDFRTEKQFQQFIELRNYFLDSERDQEKLYEWECRREFDFWGWRDLWLNGGLMLIFNMSALAYVISAVCDALPVASIEVDRGQIEGG